MRVISVITEAQLSILSAETKGTNSLIVGQRFGVIDPLLGNKQHTYGRSIDFSVRKLDLDKTSIPRLN